MKILAISDTVDPLVYSNNISNRFGDVDLVISCGDLPFHYYDFIVSTLNLPLLYVLGNHPPPVKEKSSRIWEESYPPGCTNLDNRVVLEKGLLIGGVEGSLRYNRDQWSKQYTDFEMRTKLWKMWPRLYGNRLLRGRSLDIMVTHAPPRGIHDRPDRCHTGFRALLPFMRRFRPRLLLHGHVHIYDRNAPRETKYGETRIINVYGHQLIEIS